MTGNPTIYGQTQFSAGKILLNKNLPKTLIRKTLVHEFTHVWLFETGRNPDVSNWTCNEEDICYIYEQMYYDLESVIATFDKLFKEDKDA